MGNNLLYILLNPSKATEEVTDPTLIRCQNRARLLGYSEFRVCNLFAFRSTSPNLLRVNSNVLGFHNDDVLRKSISRSDVIICSWGNFGAIRGRDLIVKSFLHKSGKPVYHLGLTKKCQPKHLLYIKYHFFSVSSLHSFAIYV